MPCIPQLKDSGACPLNDRTGVGRRPSHIASAHALPAHNHIVSALVLAACRRGMAWSRRCRSYIPVGGLLEPVSGHRAFPFRGYSGAVAAAPAAEVVL